MSIFGSIKGVILFLAAVAVAGILLGFFKAAWEQRKISRELGKEEAARRAAEEAERRRAEEEKAARKQAYLEKAEKKKAQRAAEKKKPKVKRLGE